MKVKVCGLKYKDNIQKILNLKPDYVGFIFYAKSKRFVGENVELPPISSDIKKVGVFVNANENYILDKINKYKLDIVQLHGEESPQFCERIKLTTEVIKAFGINEDFDFKKLEDYKTSCNYFLFDTKTPDFGGSGEQFNWELLKKYTAQLPFFLSGGVALNNIKDILLLKAQLPYLYAIDVNSKFEIVPAIKDVEMINKLIRSIR
ncbi:MAG: phosphoribosylanthranilate isomerase [Bacteroidia bacterium]